MSKVAIIGSCITRDLWPILGEAPSDLLYISRTSLPSLLAPPLLGLELAEDPPEALKRHQHRAVVMDLRKTALEALVRHRPSHIIFDFIDERFDLLAVAGTLATHSWELTAGGYLDQAGFEGAQVTPRISPDCDRLWTTALGELAGLIAATPLRDAQLILHEAQWAPRYLDADGVMTDFDPVLEVLEGQPASFAAHNALLARYNDQFVQATGATRVRTPDALRIGDAAHRWGLSPFHYTPGYYREIWRQLRQAGV